MDRNGRAAGRCAERAAGTTIAFRPGVMYAPRRKLPTPVFDFFLSRFPLFDSDLTHLPALLELEAAELADLASTSAIPIERG